MSKWYAIIRPDGEYCEDAVAMTEKDAWSYAADVEADFPRHPEYHHDEYAKMKGYQCVEVMLTRVKGEK